MGKDEGSIYSLDSINNGALLPKRQETLPQVYYDRPLYPNTLSIRHPQNWALLTWALSYSKSTLSVNAEYTSWFTQQMEICSWQEEVEFLVQLLLNCVAMALQDNTKFAVLYNTMCIFNKLTFSDHANNAATTIIPRRLDDSPETAHPFCQKHKNNSLAFY